MLIRDALFLEVRVISYTSMYTAAAAASMSKSLNTAAAAASMSEELRSGLVVKPFMHL
jgi:hypothetical protein